MVEISAFPANTSVGTTTSIVTCNGTGTGGSLLSSGLVLKEALAESSTGTSIAGTNTILADIGGTPTLVPVSALPSGLVLEQGTSTLTGVGTLLLSTGLTLTGSGGVGTLTASGGSGGFQAGPIDGTSAFTRPDVSAFTTLYSGSGSFTEISGGPIVYQGPSPTGFNWSCLGQAISGATTLTALIETHGLGSDTAGIYVADSSGKFIALTSNGSTLNVNAWDSGTSYGGTTYTEVVGVFLRAHWYRVVYDGTNLTWYYSSNGIAYTKLIEFTVASSILAGVATGGFTNLAYQNPTNDSVSYLWDFVV